MKKILAITGICITTLLIIILVLPLTLKGKIGEIVKTEGNKMINAHFDFETLDINLFRNFPSATISLEDFWLKGNGGFEKDTLVKAKEVSATVNLFSLFGNKGYEISEFLFDEVKFHAIVLKDGRKNWNILKSTEVSEHVDNEKGNNQSQFNIQLKHLTTQNLSIIYDNQETNDYTEIKDLNAICSGDFGNERTLLKLHFKTPSATYRNKSVTLIHGASIASIMDIDADFKNGKYVLKKNSFAINAIEASLDGWINQLKEGWKMNLSISSNLIGFKEILSLVPGIYNHEFESLQTDGTVKFSAFARGILKKKESIPTFEVKLDVNDGYFHYPSLSGSIDHINLDMSVKNPGTNLNATTVDISSFQFFISGHPFGISAQLRTPISDLDIHLKAKGKLDLGKMKDVYPMPQTNLDGIIDANLCIAGKLSDIAKEQYDNIQAYGNVNLSHITLGQIDFPDINIEQSTFNFSPKYLKLSETTIKMGDNDITFDSQFENYLAYVFQGKTLEGTLNLRSNLLNLNDFMFQETTNEKGQTSDINTDNKKVNTPHGTQSCPKGLIVPNNINFTMQTHLKKVMLDSMVFENVEGLLSVKGQKIDMSNLSMYTMGGKVVANGTYATPTGQHSSLKGNFSIQELGFNQAYKELDIVQQLAPIFAGLKGSFSGKISIDAPLDGRMNLDLHNVQGNGSLSTKGLGLSGVKFIDQVADIVKKPELKDIQVDNLLLDFSIDNGRVTTQPFDLKLGDYSMNLSGSTGLDQTINYRGKITMPSLSKGKKRYGTVDMLIKGTFNKPEVSIDMASLAQNIVGQMLDNLNKPKTISSADSLTPKKKSIIDKALDLFKK